MADYVSLDFGTTVSLVYIIDIGGTGVDLLTRIAWNLIYNAKRYAYAGHCTEKNFSAERPRQIDYRTAPLTTPREQPFFKRNAVQNESGIATSPSSKRLFNCRTG